MKIDKLDKKISPTPGVGAMVKLNNISSESPSSSFNYVVFFFFFFANIVFSPDFVLYSSLITPVVRLSHFNNNARMKATKSPTHSIPTTIRYTMIPLSWLSSSILTTGPPLQWIFCLCFLCLCVCY